MAFYDNWGKKLSQGGQDAMQKLKETTDVTKFNSEITSYRREIEEKYLELGRKYCEDHLANAAADPYAEILTQVAALEEKIEENRRQIREIRGLVLCPSCGKEVKSTDMFCNHCGGRMPVVVKPEEPKMVMPKNCTRCGAKLFTGQLYCTECGQKVEPVPAEPEAPKRGICRNCGAVLEEGALFCIQCGTRIEEPEACAVPEAPILPEAPAAPEPPAESELPPPLVMQIPEPVIPEPVTELPNPLVFDAVAPEVMKAETVLAAAAEALNTNSMEAVQTYNAGLSEVAEEALGLRSAETEEESKPDPEDE